MAYIYSTTSPYYFDYLASVYTRDELLADPDKCKYLENPYLKDNMELALKFNEAQRGGYNQKKDFIEYFLCNGPEIDTDTIMHYREKCYQDPIYLQIAEIEFSDIEIVDEIRVTKYGKKNDLGDCFTQPCNYLGPLSSTIGIMGDSNNFRTMPNIFSVLLAQCKKKKEDEEKEKNKDKKSSSTDQKTDSNSSTKTPTNATEAAQEKKKEEAKKEGEDSMKDVVAAWGNIRTHITNMLLPNIRQNMQVMYDNMYEHAQNFANECVKAGITDSANIGDKDCIARADKIAAATKVNTYNQLGDCARLWEQMRRFNPYDSTQNSKGPIPDGKLAANKNVNGTSIDSTPKPTVISKLPKSTLNEAAAAGNRTAEVEKNIQELDYDITAEGIAFYTDPNIPEDERFAVFEIKFKRQLDKKFPLEKDINETWKNASNDPAAGLVTFNFETQNTYAENVGRDNNARKRRKEFARIVSLLNKKKAQTTDLKEESQTSTQNTQNTTNTQNSFISNILDSTKNTEKQSPDELNLQKKIESEQNKTGFVVNETIK